MYGLRLITILAFVMAILCAGALVNVYFANSDVFHATISLFGGYRISAGALVLVVFLLGFFLNLIYNAVMALRGMVKGLNASAATRAGKRLLGQLQDARELVAHGLLGQARASLEAVLRERGDSEPAQLLLGEVLLKLGDHAEAVALFRRLAAQRGDAAEPRYLLADALLGARDPDGAVQVLAALAGDHPKEALRALRRLRTLHGEAGRWEEALEVHRRLLARFAPELNQAERAQGTALLYQLGMARVEADQFKEAAQIFQQILKEEARFVPAYLSLGRCMILQDQEPQGLEIWIEGFRATGEGALLQELEDYFIQCGKPEEGLALLRRVAATSEHATTSKFFLGKMLYRLEILDEALDVFQEVRAQVVYSPILFFFMGKIHARRGRLEQALTEYRQLLRNLGILKLRFECGACYHRTVDYADRCESCGAWNSVHFLFRESELPDMPAGPWLSAL